MAKASGVWDVDKLESECPVALMVEWNQYLDWELNQYAQAITGMLPGAGRALNGDCSPVSRVEDNPEKIGRFLDSIGFKTIED